MTQPQSVIRSTFSVTAVTRNGTETETAEGVRETKPTVTRQRRDVARGRCRPLLHNNTHSRPCLGDMTDSVYHYQLGYINNRGRHVRAPSLISLMVSADVKHHVFFTSVHCKAQNNAGLHQTQRPHAVSVNPGGCPNSLA